MTNRRIGRKISTSEVELDADDHVLEERLVGVTFETCDRELTSNLMVSEPTKTTLSLDARLDKLSCPSLFVWECLQTWFEHPERIEISWIFFDAEPEGWLKARCDPWFQGESENGKAS